MIFGTGELIIPLLKQGAAERVAGLPGLADTSRAAVRAKSMELSQREGREKGEDD